MAQNYNVSGKTGYVAKLKWMGSLYGLKLAFPRYSKLTVGVTGPLELTPSPSRSFPFGGKSGRERGLGRGEYGHFLRFLFGGPILGPKNQNFFEKARKNPFFKRALRRPCEIFFLVFWDFAKFRAQNPPPKSVKKSFIFAIKTAYVQNVKLMRYYIV